MAQRAVGSMIGVDLLARLECTLYPKARPPGRARIWGEQFPWRTDRVGDDVPGLLTVLLDRRAEAVGLCD